MSSSEEEITEKYINNWRTNQNSGSDTELKVDNSKKSLRICLKQVPNDLTDNGLRKLCQQFGPIVDFHRMNAHPYFSFVTYTSLGDMQDAMRGFASNDLMGITAMYAREKKSDNRHVSTEVDEFLKGNRDSNSLGILGKPPGPDFEPIFDPATRDIHVKLNLPTTFCKEVAEIEITEKHYREHPKLMKSDATKQYLFDAYKQNIEQSENKYLKIIYGRVVFKHHEKSLQKLSKSTTNPDKQRRTFLFSSDDVNLLADKFCEYCGSLADKYCNKCEANFCSTECLQRNQAHEQNCTDGDAKITEIKENETNEANKEVPVRPEPIEHGDEVVVTCAVDQQTLFVRPAAAQRDEDYIKIIQDVQLEAMHATPLKNVPECGDWVLAPWQMIYNRALVLKVNSPEDIICAFIDFGNVDVCKQADLKYISADLQARSWLVNRISLENVPNGFVFRDGLKEVNQMLLTNERYFLLIRAEDSVVPVVRLVNCSSEYEINGEIAAIYEKEMQPDSTEMLSLNNIQFDNIEGNNINVIITENNHIYTGDVSVMKVSDVEQFCRLRKKVNAISSIIFANEKVDCFTPRKGQLCLIRLKQGNQYEYYRTICLECVLGVATLDFVDYGNIYIVPITDVRRLPSILLDNILTFCVNIKGLDLEDSQKSAKEIVSKADRLLEVLPIGMEVTINEIAKVHSEEDESISYTAEIPSKLLNRLKDILDETWENCEK